MACTLSPSSPSSFYRSSLNAHSYSSSVLQSTDWIPCSAFPFVPFIFLGFISTPPSEPPSPLSFGFPVLSSHHASLLHIQPLFLLFSFHQSPLNFHPHSSFLIPFTDSLPSRLLSSHQSTARIPCSAFSFSAFHSSPIRLNAPSRVPLPCSPFGVPVLSFHHALPLFNPSFSFSLFTNRHSMFIATLLVLSHLVFSPPVDLPHECAAQPSPFLPFILLRFFSLPNRSFLCSLLSPCPPLHFQPLFSFLSSPIAAQCSSLLIFSQTNGREPPYPSSLIPSVYHADPLLSLPLLFLSFFSDSSPSPDRSLPCSLLSTCPTLALSAPLSPISFHQSPLNIHPYSSFLTPSTESLRARLLSSHRSTTRIPCSAFPFPSFRSSPIRLPPPTNLFPALSSQHAPPLHFQPLFSFLFSPIATQCSSPLVFSLDPNTKTNNPNIRLEGNRKI